MKISELLQAKEALIKILNIKLPVEEAIKVAKFVKEIDPELVAFEKVRESMIKKHGEEEPSKEGLPPTGRFKVKPENMKEFGDEMQKALDQEVKCKPPVISLKNIKDSIEPRYLHDLSFMIVEMK